MSIQISIQEHSGQAAAPPPNCSSSMYVRGTSRHAYNHSLPQLTNSRWLLRPVVTPAALHTLRLSTPCCLQAWTPGVVWSSHTNAVARLLRCS